MKRINADLEMKLKDKDLRYIFFDLGYQSSRIIC